MSIQAPPNLSPGVLPQIVAAGINDWGGVSPLTPDYVNPEAPWPHLEELARETAAAGKFLHERLTVYPAYVQRPDTWLDEPLRSRVLRPRRRDRVCRAPTTGRPAKRMQSAGRCAGRDPRSRTWRRLAEVREILERAQRGDDLTEARGRHACSTPAATISPRSCTRPMRLRQQVNGDVVSYVVNRNINYTNVCYFKCQFCAFSKGKLSENLRGRPYDLSLEEIQRRTRRRPGSAAPPKCACRAVSTPTTPARPTSRSCTPSKSRARHARPRVLAAGGVAGRGDARHSRSKNSCTRLKAAGLGTLPGTAAEILDDEVRAIICPDKINTAQWFEVMDAAHRDGFSTTATIMYGHVDQPEHWARHLLRIRELQQKTGGFTEFVPLPFVHMEAPMYLKGSARRGPTFREAVLMHAVARLVLHPPDHRISRPPG